MTQDEDAKAALALVKRLVTERAFVYEGWSNTKVNVETDRPLTLTPAQARLVGRLHDELGSKATR